MDEKLLAKVRNVTIWAAGRQYAEVAINLPDIRGQGPRQYMGFPQYYGAALRTRSTSNYCNKCEYVCATPGSLRNRV